MRLWLNYIRQKEASLGSEIADKWLKTLRVIKFDARNLYLETLDKFHANWVKEHIEQELKETFVNEREVPIRVHFSIAGSEASTKQESQPTEIKFKENFLEPHATFETFIPGSNNEIPFQILSTMATIEQKPVYNPVYVYGPSGSGKTHLLMSIAKSYQAIGLKPLYVNAQKLISDVIQSYRYSELPAFRKQYRKHDILIIDDIHLVSNKRATQEEIFHTFNDFHIKEKQIILSSSVAPRDLIDIEERLISRFEWGLTLFFSHLSQKDLQSMVEKRLQLLQLKVSIEAKDFLISTFKNQKKLLRALDALYLRDQSSNNSELSLERVQIHLKDLIEDEDMEKLSSESILEFVSQEFDVAQAEVIGKSQEKEIAFPRKIGMYLLREKLKLPYKHIGKIFSRDHSTVMSNIKMIKSLIEQEKQEAIKPLAEIEKKISLLTQ